MIAAERRSRRRSDQEAEKAGIRYSFANVEAQSWSDRPAPRNSYKRKR